MSESNTVAGLQTNVPAAVQQSSRHQERLQNFEHRSQEAVANAAAAAAAGDKPARTRRPRSELKVTQDILDCIDELKDKKARVRCFEHIVNHMAELDAAEEAASLAAGLIQGVENSLKTSGVIEVVNPTAAVPQKGILGEDLPPPPAESAADPRLASP